MSEKMRKMLALVCVAVLMAGTATLPAAAEDDAFMATPVEAVDPTPPDGGKDKSETVTPTTPISNVKMQVIDGNSLRVFGDCEKDQAVNVTLCNADGIAIVGDFNPHKVKRANTAKGTFDTTFTGLMDGTYRVKVSYAAKNDFKAVEPLTDGATNAVTIAAAGGQDNGSLPADAVTQPPVDPEPVVTTAPAVTAPTTAISGVQASLSGTKDIAVSGYGEAGQTVIIQVYKGDEATNLTHKETVGSGGAFGTKFTDMNANEYRICAYYEAAPDQKVFADGVVSVGAQSQPNPPADNGTSNGDNAANTPNNDLPEAGANGNDQGNDLTPVVPMVKDATTGEVQLGEPKASQITDSSVVISGSGENEKKVEIKVNGQTQTVTVTEGSYSASFTGLSKDTQYEATAKYEGNTSEVKCTFKTAKLPIPKLTLEPTDVVGGEASISVSGTTEANMPVWVQVVAKDAFTESINGQADDKGEFTVNIPIADQTGEFAVEAYVETRDVTNYEQKFDSVNQTVTIKPVPVDLKVGAAYNAETGLTISGTGKPNEPISIQVGKKNTFDETIDANGGFSVTKPVEGEGDMEVIVSYKTAGIGAEGRTIVNVPVPPKTVDIKVTSAVGGVSQVVLTGTAKANAEVEATVGGVTGKATVGADGSYTLTVNNVPKGDYKDIAVKYTDGNNGNSATWNGTITVTEPVSATDVTITKMTPEVGKVTIIGTAKAGERVVASMVTPENKTVTRGIAVDANGSYTIVFDGLVSGTYKTLVVQYVNEGVGKQAAYPGDIAVPAPSVEKPTLQVDKLYTDSLVVVGKTTPNLKVTVSTSYGSTQYTYSQNSGSDGVFRIPLARTQSVGATVRVTVTYGNNETVYVDVGVEKTTQKPTYLTLSRYKGSRGVPVFALQDRLKELGYSISQTGVFDYQTEEAVRQFQRTNGLDVDGVAGRNTQTLLYSVAARPNGSVTPDRYPVLVRGDRGSAVSRLQQRLKDLGYYTIKVDGIYGVGTQSAVRAFQRVNNLTQTGTANSYTQQVLYSSAALPLNDYTSNYVYLSRGSRGSAVTRLQSRLAALGYYYGSLDGIYGSATQTAVRRFQSRNGISATGAADVNTQTVLFGSGAIANGSSGGSSVGYVYLHYGSRGTAVTRLQQALKDKGYLKGKVDGIYGDQTYDAVKSFQRAKGLAVDGIAGRKTQNALYGTNY